MILALAPHTDDVCLGAGGFVAAAVNDKTKVTIVAFGTGNEESGATVAEFHKAAAILGAYSVEPLRFEARAYPDHRQKILSYIEAYVDELSPDLLLIPGCHDHQDHITIHNEAMRVARSRPISVLAYEQPWNQLMHGFRPNAFMPLEFRHLAAKVRALQAFESQKDRVYLDPNYMIANAIRWGAFARTRFAEAFEVKKWML